MDLVQFQYDVTHGHDDDIKTFIAALAQERGNKNLEALGKEYGLTTGWWDGMFDGYRVMLARDLARECYGYTSLTNLSMLFRSHDLEIYSLGGKNSHHSALVKSHFGLAKTVNAASFVAWPHLLLLGAKGETEFARKVWTYIHAMVQVAEADQESRAQTGMGVQENVQRQLHTDPDAAIYREALDEVQALKALLLEMGYHPTTALIEGVKHAERRVGLDLSAYLNASPLMLEAPPEAHYYHVSALEKRFGIPRQGNAGHHLNLLLENYGMQARMADGEWYPTDQARSRTIHGVPICQQVIEKHQTWTGKLLKWQADFVASVAQWYHMKHAQHGGK